MRSWLGDDQDERRLKRNEPSARNDRSIFPARMALKPDPSIEGPAASTLKKNN
jgi:hypothetical protein